MVKIDKPANENASEDSNLEQAKTDEATSEIKDNKSDDNKEDNCWSKEDFETFKKLLDESFSNLATRSDISSLCEKTIVKENDVNNEEDNESLEDAKLWAKKQKSTWLNK